MLFLLSFPLFVWFRWPMSFVWAVVHGGRQAAKKPVGPGTSSSNVTSRCVASTGTLEPTHSSAISHFAFKQKGFFRYRHSLFTSFYYLHPTRLSDTSLELTMSDDEQQQQQTTQDTELKLEDANATINIKVLPLSFSPLALATFVPCSGVMLMLMLVPCLGCQLYRRRGFLQD
jgi:hypothetical protein